MDPDKPQQNNRAKALAAVPDSAMPTESTPSDPTALPTRSAETPAETQARAELCGRELARVLTRHRCRIAPYLLPPESVGQDGSKAILQATFGIAPEQLP